MVQLKAAIEHANGHAGKITVSGVPAVLTNKQAITLTQTTTGPAGNLTIANDDISQITVSGFTGGLSKTLVSANNFISASIVGTAVGGGIRRTTVLEPPFDAIADSFIPTDFVGLNTTVIEPITASSFTLGYPNYLDVAHYYNYSDIGAFATNTENQESFVEQIGTTAEARSWKSVALNSVISHRQGPYGHPTWKQIRVGQGGLGRHYRKNNLYTNTLLGGESFSSKMGSLTETITPRRGDTLIVSQSVITSRYHPIKQELLVVTGEGRGKSLIRPLMVMSSYANNIVYFDDSNFANKIGIEIKKGFSAYNQIKDLYLADAVDNPSSPVVGVARVIYTETVWPSLKYSHTNKIRGRTDFTNNFWRDSRPNRQILAITEKSTNSAGLIISQSAWSMDAKENFVSQTDITLPPTHGGTGSQEATGHKAGELQNEYVHYHFGTASQTYAGALYARKHIYPSTASIVPVWGMEIPEIKYEKTLSGPSMLEVLSLSSLSRGEAKWEAGDHAGAYEGTSSAFVRKPVNPFYDSYDKYFADIKSKGKDYSIIPEFRVTDHLAFYRDQSYDYGAENEKCSQSPKPQLEPLSLKIVPRTISSKCLQTLTS